MEVGGKECGTANSTHKMLGDSPRQAKAIVRTCAAPKLINDYEGICSSTLQRPLLSSIVT